MELFGTAGIRGPVEEVTPALALAVGQAASADGTAFVVGRDGRVTGPALENAVVAGLESAGADVERAGTVPTPALAFASQGRRGIMLTASHNPPPDNGIKVFVDGVEYDREAEQRLEARVDDGTAAAGWDAWGEDVRADPLAAYREAVVEFAAGHGAAPDGMMVAVDCGTGMASLATPQVLTSLGADVRALNANVDGHFSARESKPTPETLADLRAFVAGDAGNDPEGGVDLGIAHDGDADRVVVIDGDGEVVHEDTVLAILAEHYTHTSDAGDPVVVTTPNASARIDERVQAAGGRVERVRLGALHEGIAAARAAGGADTEVTFAAEPWKHIHTALGGWIDGVASAAVFTRLVASEGLAALRDPVTERPYRKDDVRCPDDAKAAVMDRLETDLPEPFPEAAVDTEHGVRLELPDGGWVLVRPSGTEPYVRVYVESESVDDVVAAVIDVVESAVAAET
ncbi:phosphomannomutase [Halobacteriales archaeon SW_10_68_16]|nr:MAG: phosphomannomutase [Halobacteriales archaeon SW_10_68_16]